MRRTNKARKYEGATLPLELLGSCGVALASCDGNARKASSSRHTPSRRKAESYNIKYENLNKASSTVWSKHFQRLRKREVKKSKDVREEYEWK